MADEKSVTSTIDNVLARLETLLRYVAPGFVVLLVLVLLDPRLRATVEHGVVPAWLTVLFAALAGIGLYSVHTGVILRPVFWRVVVGLGIKACPYSKTVTDKMFDLDTERWRRRASVNPEVMVIQNELDRWAALVNFLYCSGYALIVALLIAFEIQSANLYRYWKLCLVCGLLLLVLASISNHGMTKRALWAATEYPKGEPRK